MKAKRFLLALFAVLLIFSLIGCAGEDGVQGTLEEAGDPADTAAGFALKELALDQSFFLAHRMEILENRLMITDALLDSAHVLAFDPEGQLQAETVLVPPENENPSRYVTGNTELSYADYGIWTISYILEMSPGGDQPYDPEYWEALTLFDYDGQILAQTELSGDLFGLGVYSVGEDLCAVEDGCLLLNDHEILHYSLQGVQDWTIESERFWGRLARDGNAVYCSTSYDEGCIYKINLTNHSVEGPVLSDCGVQYFFVSGNVLFGWDEAAIYVFDLTTGERTSSVSLSSLGIAALLEAAPLNDGIAIIYHSALLDTRCLGFLETAIPIAETGNALQIGMVTGQKSDILLGVMQLFQVRHPDIPMRTVEYASIDEFATAILTGTAPDLICLQNLPAVEYAHRGLLCDLYDCIDPGVLVPAYRQWELDGGLYAITPDFTLGALIGDPAVIASQADSFSQLKVQVENSGRPVGFGPFASRLIAYSLDEFVDLEAGTCTFDSPEFTALLQICLSKTDMDPDSEQMPAIAPLWITSLEQYAQIVETGMIDLGFPRGAVVTQPEAGLVGIYAYAAHKDSAEQFIQFLLSDEVQGAVLQKGEAFPVLDAALQNMLDRSGLDAGVLRRFQDLLDNVQGVDLSTTAVYQIILSELDAFLDGTKSAEETARLIQSRASLYLAEVS